MCNISQVYLRRARPCVSGATKGARWLALLFCVVALVGLAGCTVDREMANVSPGVDLAARDTFYVVKFGPDNRGINLLIRDRLTEMGFRAQTGPDGFAPDDAEVIVTYRDKWMWDITMYMLELEIKFREPGTQRLLAVGESYHTSLSRLTPEEMVKQVLGNIFAKLDNGV